MINGRYFVTIGAVGAAILAGGMLMLFQNQKNMNNSFKKLLAQVQQQSKIPSEVKIIEKVLVQQPWAAIQDKTKDTVVQIISQTAEINLLCPYVTPKQGGSLGTGFFINEREIITNAHVIEDAQTVWVRFPSLGKQLIDVEIVGQSPERDLALLRLTDASYNMVIKQLDKIASLELGDSDQVHRADELLTLGYPLGQTSLKSTTGVVSGREHIGGRQLIQISSPINQGSSGGPSLDRNGKVIGLTVAGILGAQNVGYIIPINELKIILEDMRKKDLLRRPFLGVLLINGSEQTARYLGNPATGGVYVVDVFKGSPFAKAGIEAGDVIYEINGHAIDFFGDLKVSYSEDKISIVDYAVMLELGNEVTLVAYRSGKRRELSFIFEQTELAPVHKIFVGKDPIDYEIFGGMLVQPLTLNHIPMLINNSTGLVKYTEFENQMKPALIVTHLIPSSQVHKFDVIREGAVIKEMNGKTVGTMEEFRDALKKSIQNNFVTIKTTDGALCVIDIKEALRDEEKLSKTYLYPISQFIQELIRSVIDTNKTNTNFVKK